MSTKDIKMESIVDLMWTEETEEDPNGAVADLGINCASTGRGVPPIKFMFGTDFMCRV